MLHYYQFLSSFSRSYPFTSLPCLLVSPPLSLANDFKLLLLINSLHIDCFCLRQDSEHHEWAKALQLIMFLWCKNRLQLSCKSHAEPHLFSALKEALHGIYLSREFLSYCYSKKLRAAHLVLSATFYPHNEIKSGKTTFGLWSFRVKFPKVSDWPLLEAECRNEHTVDPIL